MRHACRVAQWRDGGGRPTGPGWLAARDRLTGLLGTGATIALIGPRGTGKTQLAACAIYDTCVDCGVYGPNIDDFAVARYTRALDIVREVNATFGSRHDSEADVIADFARPSLLVIDECQVRRGTESEDVILTDLIDKRYGDRKDTILISNETEPEFTRSIGSSAYDRIIETGCLIVCDWQSYRNPN